jgi:intracellular septation protein A
MLFLRRNHSLPRLAEQHWRRITFVHDRYAALVYFTCFYSFSEINKKQYPGVSNIASIGIMVRFILPQSTLLLHHHRGRNQEESAYCNDLDNTDE